MGKVTHGNLFLAAFSAGITVATFGERQRESFEHFGELIAELFKLAALLVFGTLISLPLLGSVGWRGWLFTVLALILARPLAIWISFLRSGLTVREQAAVAWFGPKGFASVVYGLLVLGSGIASAHGVFQIVAVTIILSILLHSSTDIVVARWFDDERDVPAWHGTAAPRSRPGRAGAAHPQRVTSSGMRREDHRPARPARRLRPHRTPRRGSKAGRGRPAPAAPYVPGDVTLWPTLSGGETIDPVLISFGGGPFEHAGDHDGHLGCRHGRRGGPVRCQNRVASPDLHFVSALGGPAILTDQTTDGSLLFVAATRARDALTISRHGKPSPYLRT